MSKNKKEAADYLGISTRALEYHVTQGHISTRKERGATGDVAMFDENELRRLKAQIDERRAPRPAIIRESDESPEAQPRSLARLSDAAPLTLLHQLAVTLGEARKNPSVPLSDKLLLSIPEAAIVSGIPADKLRVAVKSRKLKAIKSVGRGLGKVKRSDLEAYVKKL
jgi:excisionase family DNA binding protein